jgi:hypothetical protein
MKGENMTKEEFMEEVERSLEVVKPDCDSPPLFWLTVSTNWLVGALLNSDEITHLVQTLTRRG